MLVQQLLAKKPYLAWYVRDPSKLSDSSVLEHVLNYGDWEDVQDFISIKGMQPTAEIFRAQLQKSRSNYSPIIRQFFTRYFATHA
jgi:hypothetical protein